MKNDLYWVWLTTKPMIIPAKITSLLERFGGVEEIYKSNDFFGIANIGVKEASALKDKSLDTARRTIRAAESALSRIITFDDEEYPDKLRNIVTPPYILYVRGDMACLDEALTIGVVGSRRYTDYGKLATMRITGALSRNGAVIISGMAAGLDSVAAIAAMRAEGRTIAVMGSGFNKIYPAQNKGLMEDIIASGGAVITEYPPDSPPVKGHFPERNRIIAGLSNGVLVTEARQRSGALITAGIAAESGRDVFAVPGSITEPNYEGAHRLIQQGAKLVSCAEDILSEYPHIKRAKPSNPRAAEESGGETQKADIAENISEPEKYKELNESDRRIISLLMKKDMHIDEISREINVGTGELSVQLTLLEMRGFVKKLPGGDYKIIV